jgi:transcriptional regulator with XRE-family HTH domain
MSESSQVSLADFINDEVKKRNMSLREFAESIGTAASTITRAVGDNPPQPGIDFLIKLSRGTGVSLMSLIKMAFPEAESHLVVPDVQSKLIADRITRLDQQDRMMVESLLLSLVEKSLSKK